MDTRTQIWMELLDAERLALYYSRLADRIQWHHTMLSLAAILGSLIAATVLLAPLDIEWVSAGLFLGVATATVVSVVFDPSRHAQIARTTSEQARWIAGDLHRLFLAEDDPDRRPALEQLARRLDEVTRVEIKVDRSLNEQCASEADTFLAAKYAVQ